MPTTTIAQRQIRDGAINDAKVAAGANIATSKLADGGNFVKRDGSVAMTGNFDAGNQKIVNLQTPGVASDAATKGYVDTAVAGIGGVFDWKASVRAATTGNINLSNPGTSSFDGVTLTSGQRLLVRAQSTESQNGIYIFNGSASALTRATDFDAWDEIPGAVVAVEEGTSLGDTVWLCPVNQGGTLDTTAVTFTKFALANDIPTWTYKEVPSGAINGSNATYTLSKPAATNSEHVYLNGMLLTVGVGNDYTMTTADTIEMATAPISGDVIVVSYVNA